MIYINVSNYSMSQVAALTGIKSPTLRIWERRYDFLKPQRTDTHIKFYSDYALRKLLNISILMNKGYRISKINKMTDEELSADIIELVGRSNWLIKFDTLGATTI